MSMSRKVFLKSLFAAAAGVGAVGILGKRALFAADGDMAEEQAKMYKAGDNVPLAGRYQCAVCGFIVEYLPKHIEKGVTFGICTVCKSGAESGPKKPNEEFWRYIGVCK